jgi:hypothetical protein
VRFRVNENAISARGLYVIYQNSLQKRINDIQDYLENPSTHTASKRMKSE